MRNISHDGAVVNVQVYGFIMMPDGDTLDNISFTLPLVKELGDQVKITTKELLPFTGWRPVPSWYNAVLYSG